MEGIWDGKRFVVKRGCEQQFQLGLQKLYRRKIGEIQVTEQIILKESLDPATLVMIVGGVAWALSRVYATKLNNYLEIKS